MLATMSYSSYDELREMITTTMSYGASTILRTGYLSYIYYGQTGAHEVLPRASWHSVAVLYAVLRPVDLRCGSGRFTVT